MTDELLVKFLLGETDPAEDREVREWISSDPAHQKHFADMELIWKTSRNLASESAVDENAAWQRFKVRVSKNDVVTEASVKRLSKSFLWLKIAAVLLVIASAALLLFRKSETIVIAQNSALTQTLPDGSEVTLNKNSSLSYSSGLLGSKRNVKLSKGEVFFQVKPDKSRPFIISAGDVAIQVVGTSFNVKRMEKQTEVIVETGIVKVSEGNETVELHAGEKVVVENRSRLKIQQSTDRLYNYYRSNQFVADNTPLWRVVEALNEAYNAHIIVENQSIANLTLTTTFQFGSLDQNLQLIRDTFDLTIIHRGNSIILR